MNIPFANPSQHGNQTGHRLIAVDILRGLVMVLMTLDHTRDFFSNIIYDPTDLTKTSAGLFLTRWITHYCAPVFIFLAGTSAYLSGIRHHDRRRLGIYLFSRGLWIAFLGISFESLIWCYTADFSELSGAVLWAIGWSMMTLAGLIYLPLPAVVGIGLLLISTHNLFDGLKMTDMGGFGPLWAVLHSGETVHLTNKLVLHPYYPLIPWIGVMATGYGCGALVLDKPQRQRQVLSWLGFVMVAVFVLFRYRNQYGDPQPWSHQQSVTFTLLSFINCEKYPPSLLYLLMTLGPALALLPWLESVTGRPGKWLVIFGREPLFFYLLHLPMLVFLALGWAWMAEDYPIPLLLPGFPQAYGYDLPIVYLIWAGVVAALYPLCRWYHGFKQQRQWLKYI
ncbi:MAG: heparan-alpha-glucosaminide N-acetyltransferase domain-containing protein [Methylovulum sp.]|nr:heparan-alpha-glucosaminide N-acetyltransferase domain-containing protein [Methylovulum sp.]